LLVIPHDISLNYIANLSPVWLVSYPFWAVEIPIFSSTSAEWTQGKLWKHGYERGELKGEMFEESRRFFFFKPIPHSTRVVFGGISTSRINNLDFMVLMRLNGVTMKNGWFKIPWLNNPKIGDNEGFQTMKHRA
jgi:hypothetical protein